MLGNSVFSACASGVLTRENSLEALGLSSAALASSVFASEVGLLTEAEDSAALVLSSFDSSFTSSGAEEGQLEEDASASADVGSDFCSLDSFWEEASQRGAFLLPAESRSYI